MRPGSPAELRVGRVSGARGLGRGWECVAAEAGAKVEVSDGPPKSVIRAAWSYKRRQREGRAAELGLRGVVRTSLRAGQA